MISSSLSEKSSALIAVERCSGFVAPMIGAVMTVFDSNQAIVPDAKHAWPAEIP